MRNLKSALDICAAGIDFRAADIRPDLVEMMLDHVSDAVVDVHDDHIHHLRSSLNPCAELAGADLYANTYRGILLNIRDYWESVGGWTWPYRAMIDIMEMDDGLKNCGL